MDGNRQNCGGERAALLPDFGWLWSGSLCSGAAEACISLEQQLARREHRGLALDGEKGHDRVVYTKLAGVGLDELVDQRRDVLSELGRV